MQTGKRSEWGQWRGQLRIVFYIKGTTLLLTSLFIKPNYPHNHIILVFAVKLFVLSELVSLMLCVIALLE